MGRKWNRAIAFGLALVLFWGGCAEKKAGETLHDKDDPTSVGTTEFVFLEETNSGNEDGSELEGVSVKAPSPELIEMTDGGKVVAGERLTWNDNKLDDYYAVLNHPIKKVEVEGENPLGGTVFLGEGGCVRHGQHTFSDYKKSWDGINGIAPDGETFEARIIVDPEREGKQIYTIGPISGRDGYVACYVEYEGGKPSDLWFYELDKDFRVLSDVHPALDAHGSPRSLMGDSGGNVHLIYEVSGGKRRYAVISPEGMVIFEKEIGMLDDILAFDAGRVAFCERVTDVLGGRVIITTERRFSDVNAQTGELEELTVSGEEAVRQKLREGDFAAAPVDDRRIFWCAKDGVHLYDVDAKEERILYRWANHGLVMPDASKLLMTKDGLIAMLYQDAVTKEMRYLLLKPTDEKEELTSITIAVHPGNKEAYEKAAAYFKMQYPAYVVNVKSDYEETSLLTQLGAGEGPVLVDTALTGFEELKTLWQPLDGFLEQTGIAEEMLPNTLEFGKIGGRTYGIVREFYVQSILVPDSGPRDWDYDGFLNALENFGGAAFTDRGVTETLDWRRKLFDVLMNGPEDNYYLDAATGETIFETPKFDRVLKISKKAMKCPPAEDGRALRNGKVMCEFYETLTYQVAIRLRRRLAANGERIIGYPTKEGARHILVACAPLALRSTATQEEKEIAYTFLKVYLSKEAMTAMRGGTYLPVRRDVLEEQFREYQEMTDSYKEYGLEPPPDLPELDGDQDFNFLMELIEGGVVRKSFPEGLMRVFDDELGDYLEGRIDDRTLSEHLKSRFWLYLEEQK